ncbi:hypothetical protein HXY32_03640 [Candidatus Bathyarchaeota archaeon]|nr:hypothetical protein [Candidatus Bathyarchaeota archaeon]
MSVLDRFVKASLVMLVALWFLVIAEEANPLGWPWAASTFLMFYVPAFAFTYWLSHGEKGKSRLLVAILITGLACFVGVTNFLLDYTI